MSEYQLAYWVCGIIIGLDLAMILVFIFLIFSQIFREEIEELKQWKDSQK